MDYQHLTKDRPLGHTELRLNDLAAEAEAEDYPYKSTGKKAEAENLKLDKGSFKGQLHYEAEFIPALALKNFEFSTSGNKIRNSVDSARSTANGEDGSVSSSDVDGEAVPAGITTRGPLGAKRKEGHVKNAKSTDTTDVEFDADSIIEPPGENEGKSKPSKGVVLSKEELMQHRKHRRSSSLSRISPWF